jgi:hypothetical protein
VKTLLLVVLAAVGMGAAKQPTSRPVQSADLLIPQKMTLPFIGDMLGRKPANLKLKAYGSRDLDRFVQRTGVKPKLEYFTLDVQATIAVEFAVQREQVSQVIAYVKKPAAANEAAVERKLAIADKRVKFDREEVSLPKWQKVMKLTFTIIPLEVYIENRNPPEEIAAALRKGEWVKGMTADDQFVVNDGPGTFEVITSLISDPYAVGAVEVGGRFAGGGGARVTYTVEAIGEEDAVRNLPDTFDPKKHEVLAVNLKTPKGK